MRTNKELFQLMLENQQYFESGLCRWINVMWINSIISSIELCELEVYIESNEPFTLHRLSKGFWWKKGDIKPRIEWIKKQIKKL